MIKVSDETKRAYMSDVSHKTLRVVFPQLNLTYHNNRIKTESLKLTESISSRNSIEFVGCIASSLQIDIYGIDANIKGKKIEVYIKADETDEIPLFKGVVDSVVIDSQSYFKKITAYDDLYEKGNRDIVQWYNQVFPNTTVERTIKYIRDSLFNYLGIQQEPISLPNDGMGIKKQFEPKSLQAILVLKSLCQFNGCCGIINRYGRFEYRYISKIWDGLFPSMTIYPSSSRYPEMNNTAHTFAFYEELKHQEYYVKPMKRVQIRKNEEDGGQTVGEPSGNKYIIQSNMFAQNLSPNHLKQVASNILMILKSVSFYPFSSKNNGLPFVEVGDAVKYILPSSRTGAYATSHFIVLSRTLSGVQFLQDNYSASGEEEQSEFITDLKSQLDTIKMNGGGGGGGTPSDVYTKEEVDDILEDYTTAEDVEEQVAEQVNQMETPTGFNVVSVYTLPPSRANDTIYLIQGGVIML